MTQPLKKREVFKRLHAYSKVPRRKFTVIPDEYEATSNDNQRKQGDFFSLISQEPLVVG